MNYFTPELIARYGSADTAVANAADDEWEEVLARYNAQFRAERKLFPRHFRTMFKRHLLHDAKLTFAGRHGDRLHLTLQLEPPSTTTLFLHYGLVRDFRLSNHPSIGGGNPDFYYMYSEVSVISEGDDPLIEHDILFSNGQEMVVRFQEFRYERAEALPMPMSMSAKAGVKQSGQPAVA